MTALLRRRVGEDTMLNLVKSLPAGRILSIFIPLSIMCVYRNSEILNGNPFGIDDSIRFDSTPIARMITRASRPTSTPMYVQSEAGGHISVAEGIALRLHV